MIKAVAISLLIAVMGSSISEFSLSPGESFTLHFTNDYVFTLSECGSDCISLNVSQMTGGIPTWTGQLFDLQQGRSYPLGMDFEDVVFDSVYVVSSDEVMTLRVSYREPSSAVSNERVVKATSEKEPVENVSILIIGELSAVVFLIFFVTHRILHSRSPRKNGTEDAEDITIPGPAMGFHGTFERGIPRQYQDEDPDLELLENMRELERLKETEMQQRLWRRMDEEESLGLDWI
ncbi:MAG: hypothetical protein HXS44_12300 [Theionarchaea archaeon]|nr:hypothetical protein [Theionarchaea archaeon]